MNELSTDRERLDAFRRGDRVVLTELYHQYAPALLRFVAHGISHSRDGGVVRLRIPSAADRLDLVHDTFVKALSDRGRQSYNGLDPFGPWLTRICRNLAIDWARKSRRRRRILEEEIVLRGDTRAQVLPRPIDSPEVSAARRQLQTRLQQFLDTLDERERELLRLYYEDDASQRQAAERMGLTRNQIRTLVARVRRRLLTELRAEGLIASDDPAAVFHLLIVLVAATGRAPC